MKQRTFLRGETKGELMSNGKQNLGNAHHILRTLSQKVQACIMKRKTCSSKHAAICYNAHKI